MGVHKLWSLLEPSSKPVKLDSLNDQVLAVDASIWLYQFITALKHQKSKNNTGEFSLEENNVFINAHLLGFFRRICKLLHYGIKPIFIFDGEVCELKKNTIMERKKKKEGNRESSMDVARRILAIQLLNKNLKKNKNKTNSEVDELDHVNKHMTQRNSEWDLPQQDKMPTEYDDGRLATIEEYENTVNQMEDELHGIDLESINPASKEFNNLPKSTQYMILYALRSKSRLRMGYSIEQLKAMFPDPVEFSKFQIEMVKRRNFFSQKLLDSTGKHGDSMVSTGKVSGTKKMYMLIKTNNGWAMSLDNNDGSSKEAAIDITNDEIEKIKGDNPNAIKNDDDSDDWEDVDLSAEKEKEEFVEDYSIKALVDATKNRLREKTPNKKIDDSAEPVFEVPYFDTFNLKSYKDIGEYNVNLVSDEEKESNILNEKDVREEIIEEESENEENKPVKKRKKMMTISLFDQDDEEKGTNFIDLVDEPLKEDKSQVVDLTDTKIEERVVHVSNISPPPPEEVIIEDDDKFVREKEPEVLSESESEEFIDVIEEPEVLPVEMDKKVSNSESPVDTSNNDDLVEIPTDVITTKTLSENISVDDKVPTILSHTNEQSNLPVVEETNLVVLEEAPNKDSTNNTAQEAALKTPPAGNKKAGLFEMEEEDIEAPITKLVDEFINIEEMEDSEDDFLGDVEVKSHAPQEKKFNQYEFFEDDEEDLVQQMAIEERDYKDLVNSKDESKLNKVFVDDGNTAVTDSTPHNDILGYSQLISRYKKLQRDAEEVTPQMVEEVQELLQHFGIPYLTAPMEAEAQCAELMKLNLVDGIITDDSDVFLFGGSKVYRKMFQEKQFVEFYDLDAIVGTLGLSRDNLIDLAFLLGSDYTLGIKGIGPVAAVEILANFGSLTKFKDWFNNGMHNSEQIAKEKGFEKSLRKKLVSNNIILSEKWPYVDVTKEYNSPTVDKDDTPFKWGKPDLDKLRTLMRNYMSWTDDKTDEVLIPLIKEMNLKSKQAKQRKVTDFFPVDYSVHNYENLSSRLKRAIDKLKDSKA